MLRARRLVPGASSGPSWRSMVMTCMSPRWLALMLLPLACAASSPGVPPAAAPLESTAEPPPASGERDAPLRRAESFTPVEGPTASAVPALLAAAKGDGLIVSRAEGLVLLDAQLRTLPQTDSARSGGAWRDCVGGVDDAVHVDANVQIVVLRLDRQEIDPRRVAALFVEIAARCNRRQTCDGIDSRS